MFCSPRPCALSTAAGATTTFTAGVAEFPALALLRPKVGDYKLLLTANMGASKSIMIRVIEGMRASRWNVPSKAWRSRCSGAVVLRGTECPWDTEA